MEAASDIHLHSREDQHQAAQVIDGKGIAAVIRAEILEEVQLLEGGLRPGLAVLLVGTRPDSMTYVRNKTKCALDCGFAVEDFKFSASVDEEEVITCIKKLNADEKVHGILVQLPLPDHMDERKIVGMIDVSKDVDGLSVHNLGSIARRDGDPYAISCTPKGVMEMLKRSGVEVSGKKCVVLGRSNLVGMPLSMLLMRADGTVTVCHSKTPDLQKECLDADILCAAVGKPEFVPGDWIKPGAVVMDIGINSVPDPESKKGYRLVGDVNFEEAKLRASMITPVPGGVGPMTIAMLLQNTLELAKRFGSR